MSKRFVTILWCFAGLLAALTLLVKSNQNKDGGAVSALAQGDFLMKDLPLKQVATIVVKDSENTVTLKRDKGQWSVAERSNYKADFPKLTRLLRSLTEATVAQSKMAGPAFDERFGMDTEAENQENHGFHLTFLDENGKELKALSVGKSTASDDSASRSAAGKYVRLADEPEAIYAVSDSFFELSATPTDWLSNDFISVTGIKEITLQPNEDDKINGWTISRSNAGSDFTIQNLGSNREPQADKLTPLKNVLSNPRFDDVLTAEAAQKQRDESKAREVTLKTFEGFQYTLDYAPPKPAEEGEEQEADTVAGGNFIVKVEVSADFPEAREKKEGESEEEAKKAEGDFIVRQQELEKKLAAEKIFAGRYFVMPDYTLSALNIGLDALAKPVVKTEAIAPTPAQPEFGPLAPKPPVGQANPPAANRPSAVSPPIAVPPMPQPKGDKDEQPEEANKEEEPPVEEKADAENKEKQPADETNNSDALNGLSEDDIKRIVEEAKKADEQE